MGKIRKVLRLKFEVGLSARQIAASVRVGRVIVGDYLYRFTSSGLSWPLPAEFPTLSWSGAFSRHRRQSPPSHDHCPTGSGCAELRRPGATLALLWQEYLLGQPQGW